MQHEGRAVRPRPQAHARRHAARQDQQRGREGREAAGDDEHGARRNSRRFRRTKVPPGPGPELNNERQQRQRDRSPEGAHGHGVLRDDRRDEGGVGDAN